MNGGIHMTQEELSRLQHIQKEIQIIQQQISNTSHLSYKYDKVRGSDSNFPYTLRSFTIEGYDYDAYYVKLDRLNKKLEQKLCELIDEKDRLNDYIESVEDPIMRMILRLKHMDGLTWSQIGDRIGYTERQCRRKYKKFFENKNV